MAYGLLIELASGQEIEPEEWEEAVAFVYKVRFVSGREMSVVNSETGATVSMAHDEHDAELYFPAEACWRPVFFWREGRVEFKAIDRFETRVLPTALDLARAMGAVVRGDEGERYGE
ncbi:MAG: hypothetical protein AAF488_00290 [Planctomycetota bacterium]